MQNGDSSKGGVGGSFPTGVDAGCEGLAKLASGCEGVTSAITGSRKSNISPVYFFCCICIFFACCTAVLMLIGDEIKRGNIKNLAGMYENNNNNKEGEPTSGGDSGS